MDVNKITEILNEREKAYGNFARVAEFSQRFKRGVRKALLLQEVTIPNYMQEAIDMIASKLARIVCGDPEHRDSWVDIAGYGQLVIDRIENELEPSEHGHEFGISLKAQYAFRKNVEANIPPESGLFDEADYLLLLVKDIIEKIAFVIQCPRSAASWFALVRSAEEALALIEARK